jgi:hypothetical protein
MKILFSILIIYFGNILFAQSDKLSSYHSSHFNKDYQVTISAKSIEDFDLFIDAASLDNIVYEGGILLKSSEYSKFLNCIDSAAAKYSEWVQVAKTNDVKELDKMMNLQCDVDAYFTFGGEWQFAFTVPLQFGLRILTKDGKTKYLLIIRTQELISSKNEFITMSGVAMVFKTPEEINAFKTAISKQNISDFIKKPKTEDLFKD